MTIRILACVRDLSKPLAISAIEWWEFAREPRSGEYVPARRAGAEQYVDVWINAFVGDRLWGTTGERGDQIVPAEHEAPPSGPNLNPHEKIKRAAMRGTGLRLTADEVAKLWEDSAIRSVAHGAAE